MGDVGIVTGQSNNDPSQGPVIDLPSFSTPPRTTIVINPSKGRMSDSEAQKAILDVYDPQDETPPSDKWGDFPEEQQQSANQQDKTTQINTNDKWDSFPEAPIDAQNTKPGYFEDLGKTIIGSTIPRSVAGIGMAAANLGNIPTQISAWMINKYGKNPLTGQPLTDEQRQNLSNAKPFFSSEDALQAYNKVEGLPPPYEPQYGVNQYLDTAGQFILGGKGMGAAASIPKLAGMGVITQGAQQIFPNNPVVPLAAAIASERGLTGAGKVMTYAGNKTGIGKGAADYQQKQAAQNIYNAATNPQQVIQDTGQQPQTGMGPMPQQTNASSLISGSNPTLAESTTDQGIAQYQDALRTKYPEPFQANTSSQNEARANALNSAKGEGNPENLGKYFTDQLHQSDAQASNQENTASQAVSSKGENIGKYGQFPSEGVTNDVIQNAQKVRGEAESKAWDFMAPYADAPADLATLRNQAKANAGEAKKYGGSPLTKVEEDLHSDILRQPSEEDTFSALKGFRTRIGDAQREVKSGTVPMRRLQLLKNAVDTAIENTVNGIVSAENEGVAKGYISSESTFESALLKGREEYYAGRRASSNSAEGSGGNAGSGYKTISGSSRAGSNTEGRSGNAPGDKSIPKFGAEQKQQYETARSVTFRNKTLTDLENSGAVNPDGTLDAKKFDRWYSKNKERFKTFPKMREELTDWRSAQEALNDMRADRIAQQNEFNKSRLSSIIKNDPVSEIGKIFRSGNPVAEFRSLVEKVRNDKPAMEGLKAAVGEHLLKVARADIAEEGSSLRSPQAFRDFIKNHNKSLKIIYGEEGVKNIENIGADIRRSQQWNERAKIKGQSNTAKDLGQVSKNEKNSIFGKIMAHAEIAGAVVSKLAGHGAGEGFLAGIPLKMINALHSAGLKNIEQIELEMIKNPSFANAMLRKIDAKEIPVTLQKRASAALLNSVPMAAAHEQQKPYKKAM